MRLVRFRAAHGPPRPGLVLDEEVVDLSPLCPTMEGIVAMGRAGALEAVRAVAGTAPRIPLAEVPLHVPILPSSLRDFLAFEDHARAGAARRGEDLNPDWFSFPVYYKGNHRSVLGPDAPLAWPPWTERLDYEMELACVLGAHARDLDGAAAEDAVFGYTILNDWSARDVQRAEMAMRLGPAKSKDFASSLGPHIVTADELDPRDGLAMSARVNGDTWSRASTKDMHWTFPQMVAHVSRGEDVYPGDVYGSGTAFGGCGLDLDRWIPRGATVEVEVEGIGVLRTPLA